MDFPAAQCRIGVGNTLTLKQPSTQNHQLAKLLSASTRNGVKISVVMPAYNVEKDVTGAISATMNVLNDITSSYEIIVIDDGSVDRTSQRVAAMGDDRVRIVKNHVNQGKGFSVKRGAEAANGEYVIMSDADMNVNPGRIIDYMHLLESADIIVSSKRHPKSVYEAPLTRKILSLGFTLLARVLTGIKASDTQTGLKAFKGESLKRAIRLVLVKRYAFDVELLAVAELLRLKTVEIPTVVRLGNRFGKGAALRMLVDLLAVAYRLRFLKWYQKNLEVLVPQYEPLFKV